MSCSGSILLIGEDPKLLFTLTLLLKRVGYSIAAAGSGYDGLRCLDNYNFKLVILNQNLVYQDGQSLLTRIHFLFPCIPVIVLSSDASLEATLQAFRAGATGYLNLPLQADQLLICVEKILNQSPVARPYMPAYAKS